VRVSFSRSVSCGWCTLKCSSTEAIYIYIFTSCKENMVKYDCKWNNEIIINHTFLLNIGKFSYF